MSRQTQTRENHVRFDPSFHFFLMPFSFVLFVWSVVHLFRDRTSGAVLLAGGMFALLFLVFKTRIYALKVQDRVIRLEERLRLQALGSEDLRGQIPELTERQLVALRFAPDAELPDLANKALDEKLTGKQIKALIRKWRGDYFRV